MFLQKKYKILMNIKVESGIVTSLVTSCIELVYEGISSYLYINRQKAVQKHLGEWKEMQIWLEIKFIIQKFNKYVWYQQYRNSRENNNHNS